MLSDFLKIGEWWLILFLIGLIFLPTAKKIFKNFFDKGYLFAKVLGIAFSSYLVWLAASLKIFSFNLQLIWVVLLVLTLVNWGGDKIFLKNRRAFFLAFSLPFAKKQEAFGNQKNQRLKKEKTPLKIFLLEELVFTSTLFFWAYIRGFQPDILGLEKFMDFGFINSILRSKYFPPADMWFAGKSINYYYFGHYVAAFLTKLSGIDSAITYNLMMATLFAFCFSLTFSLTANLVFLWEKNSLKVLSFRSIVGAGLISALVISLGANLHPAYYNFKMKVLKKPYCNGSFFYWYPDATRYIGYCPEVDDKTIHEFPAYSFIVSDLHGHVSDIPFVLTFLAIGMVLFKNIKENGLGGKGKNISKKIKTSSFIKQILGIRNVELDKELAGLIILASFLLGIAFMTNQWDYPIYLIVLGSLVFVASWLKNEKNFGEKAILKTGGVCLAVVTLSILWVSLFLLNFDQIAKGVDFVHAHSRFYQLLILWGGFWVFGISFFLFLFFTKIRGKNFPEKGSLAKTNSSLVFDSDWIVIVMIGVSTLLVAIPEIVYLKDIYISSYHRANTMFKLTYQSFIMYCLCLGYIFARVLLSLKNFFLRKALFFCYLFLFSCFMVYPFYSVKGYYGILKRQNYKGLYGLSFLKRLYPDDYETVLWFKKSVVGQPNILEAVGDSYTDYERISMATGLPTIQGWLVHEWLWRGSFDEPGKRASEVQLIYETKDEKQAKEILDRYNVRYVIVGEMERQKYPLLDENKFEKIGEKVFQSGKTVVYKIN